MKITSTRGAATRLKILEAAAELIQRHGFNGTSIDDILIASGTGKSQFYHHFDSKQQLVIELVGYHRSSMPLASLLKSSDFNEIVDFEDALDKLVQGHREGHYPHGCPISNLATELVASEPDLSKSFEEFFRDLHVRFIQILKHWRYRGIIRAEVDPEQIACFLESSIEGALLLAKITRDHSQLVYSTNQIKVFLRSLAPKTESRSQLRKSVRLPPMTYCP